MLIPKNLDRFHAPTYVAPTYQVDLMQFAMSCKDKGLFPALAFQLDSFQTIECFKNLLGALEQGQAAKYPEYYDELEDLAPSG